MGIEQRETEVSDVRNRVAVVWWQSQNGVMGSGNVGKAFRRSVDETDSILADPTRLAPILEAYEAHLQNQERPGFRDRDKHHKDPAPLPGDPIRGRSNKTVKSPHLEAKRKRERPERLLKPTPRYGKEHALKKLGSVSRGIVIVTDALAMVNPEDQREVLERCLSAIAER